MREKSFFKMNGFAALVIAVLCVVFGIILIILKGRIYNSSLKLQLGI